MRGTQAFTLRIDVKIGEKSVTKKEIYEALLSELDITVDAPNGGTLDITVMRVEYNGVGG